MRYSAPYAPGSELAARRSSNEGRPIIGSWWKTFVARVKNPAEEDVRNGAKLAARAVSLHGLDARQAEVDKMQAEAFAAVMKALEGVEQAVIHSGTLLVVKNGDQVIRRELSQLDVENLRRHSILTTRPATILQELTEPHMPLEAKYQTAQRQLES